ncbi:MAG: rod shape determining protein RodA [Pseudonocardiales bacterium]|nr:rod shape determining protein RodA [Pseudonocardiales bacterium]
MTLLARNPRDPFALPEPITALGRRSSDGYDLVLAGAALALGLIGAVLVWAATRDTQRAVGANPQAFADRHLFNLAIAAGLMLAASRIDARVLRLFGPVVYLGSLLGLVAVFVIGSTVNGAHAWIELGGGFSLQPSEFMKLGLIVGMAVWFAQRAADRDDDGPPATRDVLAALLLIAVPLALIMLQPDLGSALVLAAAAFGVLITADVQARWTLGLVVVAVIVAVLAVRGHLLAEYQLQRFTSFTDPGRDVLGAAYNITQARIAIANGGLSGTGLFHGPQTNGGYVPEQQTDFVFSVAGEELGLVGGAVIIALFAVLCWRGLRIARDADPAGRLVAVGIVCWFAFQAFQNIGMNLGLTPVTGLPLPLVSYGGSSMFAEGLAIGLLQAVHRRGTG